MPLLLPRVPGRLPWSVTRGLTNRWPLDDGSASSSASGVVYDIVGNAYAACDSSQFPTSIDGPASSRGLRFGAGGSTPTAAYWTNAPTPATGWTGTMSFWLWLDQYSSTDVGSNPRVLAIGTTNFLTAGLDGTSGTYIDFILDGINGAFTPTGGALPLSRWAHIAVTWDGGTAKGYQDGVSLSAFVGQNSSAVAGVYALGARNTIAGALVRGLVGRMADLRFYTRTVLTAAEIAELYYSAFVPDEVMPALFVAAAGGFIPAWARNSNLPVIGTGTY